MASTAPGAPAPHPHPQQIGPYRILDTLGEGGMGTVYLAEQSKPVQRRVALKLIKLGMDSKAVVARFEQERQALALMQHDGIAKVFDCGLSERGQPFFVMELVKGVPLTDFCNQGRLSLPQRIALLQQICAAVTHAHQKGVVHRDLKPGNVLVSEDQGKVQIKVIDFGLAKAMGKKLVEATLFTEAGQVIGTPEYMAPEQADPTNADIDTRADIYSIGVMLYEVLVGALPFSQDELRRAGLLEMQRVLREVEPPKPSTKLSAVRATAVAIAEQRRTSAAALHRALKNDLDWLVLKALEKDPARRYDTANALAMDLQRYLDHEPLVAGPPSAGYRLKKLVRRYRGQVVAGSLVLAALLAGGIGTFVQYLRAEDKAAEALEQKGKAETNATLAQNNATLANTRAEENAKLAQANGALAEEKSALAAAEAAAKDGLAGKVREFDQLSGVVAYDRLMTAEAELYPALPGKVAAMEGWLLEAERLLGLRGELAATIDGLRARALPYDEEAATKDREAHPRFGEWQALAARVAALQHAQRVRDGGVLATPEVPPELKSLTLKKQHDEAWSRVAPAPTDGGEDERTVPGQEAMGLVLARTMVARYDNGDRTMKACSLYDTLAWALFANGQDDAALVAAEQAVEVATNDQETHEKVYARLAAAIDGAAATLAESQTSLSELAAVVSVRRTWAFAPADEAQRFLHEALTGLLGRLEVLAAKEKPGVEHRLGWARSIQSLSLAHPQARHTWASVRAAIARNAKYAGCGIELREPDITGLVPIGENPMTGLWEFYDLRSAWDGQQDPAKIAIPTHEPDGSTKVTEATGIVFVLLPGSTVTLGSQGQDEDAPFFDPGRQSDEALHVVTLAPFFLARHELTQAQWSRLWTWDEGERDPSYNKRGEQFGGQRITGSNPVEQVDWRMCATLLSRHGLLLPTEAQWECGCRGGTTSVWWSGSEAEDLAGKANVFDATGAKSQPQWGNPEPFDDRHVVHAPVGSFAANGFGLFDVHGNVWEWCLDSYGDYGTERAGDGLRMHRVTGSSYRCNRGGSFYNPAAYARSAIRNRLAPAIRIVYLGVRAARLITY